MGGGFRPLAGSPGRQREEFSMEGLERSLGGPRNGPGQDLGGPGGPGGPWGGLRGPARKTNLEEVAIRLKVGYLILRAT